METSEKTLIINDYVHNYILWKMRLSIQLYKYSREHHPTTQTFYSSFFVFFHGIYH